jgi:hypothetical protein
VLALRRVEQGQGVAVGDVDDASGQRVGVGVEYREPGKKQQ